MTIVAAVTVNSNNEWVVLAAIAAFVLSVCGIAGYMYRYMIRPAWRSASAAYHADIKHTVATQLLPIVAELTPNHGASMKDNVTALIGKVDALAGSLADHREAFDEHVAEDKKVAEQVQQLIDQTNGPNKEPTL